MPISERVETLISRLARERQFPTQGETIFVDLEHHEVRRAYIPRHVVEAFLGGRGVNMFLLHNLLDPSLDPLHPDVPLIFGTGILTSLVPSAARGNVTSWSPETKVILDSNAGDYFPSFMKLNGIDHLVVYVQPRMWTVLHCKDGEFYFFDSEPWIGMDNLVFRAAIERDFRGQE